MDKRIKEQMEELEPIFYELSQYLIENKGYIMINACNEDATKYCIPKGSQEQVTYYGKPEKSIRISDHWSWYANLTQCTEEDDIQCFNVDMPFPGFRLSQDKASLPIEAAAIAV